MKAAIAVFALACALVSATAGAATTQLEETLEVGVVDADGTKAMFDVSDLETDEVRQFFTDAGQEVVVTRTATGLTVDFDGEQTELTLPELHMASGHHFVFIGDDGPHGHDGEVEVEVHVETDHEQLVEVEEGESDEAHVQRHAFVVHDREVAGEDGARVKKIIIDTVGEGDGEQTFEWVSNDEELELHGEGQRVFVVRKIERTAEEE